jgi:hypothetical protein
MVNVETALKGGLVGVAIFASTAGATDDERSGFEIDHDYAAELCRLSDRRAFDFQSERKSSAAMYASYSAASSADNFPAELSAASSPSRV